MNGCANPYYSYIESDEYKVEFNFENGFVFVDFVSRENKIIRKTERAINTKFIESIKYYDYDNDR